MSLNILGQPADGNASSNDPPPIVTGDIDMDEFKINNNRSTHFKSIVGNDPIQPVSGHIVFTDPDDDVLKSMNTVGKKRKIVHDEDEIVLIGANKHRISDFGTALHLSTVAAAQNISLITDGAGVSLSDASYAFRADFDNYSDLGEPSKRWKDIHVSGQIDMASNVIVGSGTFTNLTTGSDNILLGGDAGREIVTADRNVMVGYLAGVNVAGGDNNVIIGTNALASAPTSSTQNDNVVIGVDACALDLTNTRNVVIGPYAASSADVQKTDCVIVGRNANCSTGPATNRIAIGRGANNVVDNSIVIGDNTASVMHTMGSGTCDLGSAANPYKNIYITGSVVTI